MENGEVKLGSITIDLVSTPDGDLQVVTDTSGTLRYITAIGMLEMAKDSLLESLEGE